MFVWVRKSVEIRIETLKNTHFRYMSKTTFILSTEEVNTYRVKLLTSGAKTEQFTKNPVMFYMHDEREVIGLWENLRVDGDKLVAEPLFDEQDEFAKKIAGKVKRKFLRASSVSARPISWHTEGEGDNEIIVFDEWELREASIVPIPSNRGALVRLVDENDVEIDITNWIKLSDRFTTTPKQKPTKKMDLKQIAKALNLSDAATEEEIMAAISKSSSAEQELATYKQQQLQRQKQEALSLADAAVSDGRLKAELKDKYLKLADTDFDLFKETLANLPKPVSLMDTLRGQQGQQSNNAPKGRETWSFSDWQQKDGEGLYIMSKTNFDQYSKLFEAEFGYKPSSDIK